jgi:hypothetical protein
MPAKAGTQEHLASKGKSKHLSNLVGAVFVDPGFRRDDEWGRGRLGTLPAPGWASKSLQGVTTMTNSKSFFQASVWMAISGLLMLAALEPVSIETAPAQIAAAPATHAAA